MTAGRTNSKATSQEWATPPKYVEAVRSFFGGEVDLDPCSNAHSIVNAKTEYRLPENNGLVESWNYPRIYVNPPYGRDAVRGTTIRNWLEKCRSAHEEFGSEVLALVPVAPNTRHWKENVWGVAAAVAFLYDTRLKFMVNGEACSKGAPMACCMIYWGADFDRFERVFLPFGAVVNLCPLQGKQICAPDIK